MILNMTGKGGGGTILVSDTLDAAGGTIRTITAKKVVSLQTKTITPTSSAQTVNPDTGYDGFSQVIVNAGGEGGNGGYVWQDENGYVHLPDEGDISLQTKSVSPSETAQTVTADVGYYALDKVNVGAVSSTYVGSGITRRSSTDLTASGATVTVPSGYYASNATKTVASGSATPASTISATGATLSTGTNTLTLSKSVSNTPTVSSGYVSSGTAGNSSVSLTASVTTQGAQTIYPSASDQSISSGRYLTGNQTIKAVTTSNLTADNIKNGVTVTVGDSADADRVLSVTGTYSGGGGSNWTLLASKDLTYSTTSTSATEIEYWNTGTSETWNCDLLCVRVRDKAGPRSGYFYGSDTYFLNPHQPYASSYNTAGRFTIYRYGTNDYYSVATTAYGVYAISYEDTNQIRLMGRYSSSYGTVNGTYSIEAYALTPPTGKPFFE